MYYNLSLGHNDDDESSVWKVYKALKKNLENQFFLIWEAIFTTNLCKRKTVKDAEKLNRRNET